MADEDKKNKKPGSDDVAVTDKSQDKRKKVEGTATAAPVAGIVIKEAKLNLSFYELSSSSRTAVFPDEGSELEIQNADGTTLQTVTLTRNKNNVYPVSFPYPTAPAPTPTETEETPCDDPTTNDATMVVITSCKSISVDCQPWDLVKVGVALSQPSSQQPPTPPGGAPDGGNPDNPNPPSDMDDAMCSVEVPLMRLEETYMVKFQALDTCREDFLTNADSLMDDVVVRLKAIQTPAQMSAQHSGRGGNHTGKHDGQAAGGNANQPSSGSIARFKPGTFTAKTVNGLAFIGGLIPNQQYQVEVIGPNGYVSVSPNLPPYIQNSGFQTYPLTACFQPCTNFPARSVVFVRKECPGVRMQDLRFSASGVQPSPCLTKDDNGVWNIPTGTTGRLDLQAAGKVFTPSSLDLGKDAPMVFVVEVADQGTEVSSSRKSRFQHVDQNGRGFGNRWIRVTSRSGQEERVLTDENGWFEAEDGSFASADEDELGFAVEAFPLLTAEID